MAKRCSSSKVEVDATKAYKKALEYDLDRGIWITDKMAQFVKVKQEIDYIGTENFLCRRRLSEVGFMKICSLAHFWPPHLIVWGNQV